MAAEEEEEEEEEEEASTEEEEVEVLVAVGSIACEGLLESGETIKARRWCGAVWYGAVGYEHGRGGDGCYSERWRFCGMGQVE